MERARAGRPLVLRARRQAGGVRLLRRLRAREQPPHRLHRALRLSRAARAARRADPRARRADVSTTQYWSSAPLWIHLAGVGWALRPDPLGRAAAIWSTCRPGNLLRLVDLAARTVATVFEAPEPIVSVGVPTLSSYSGRNPRSSAPSSSGRDRRSTSSTTSTRSSARSPSPPTSTAKARSPGTRPATAGRSPNASAHGGRAETLGDAASRGRRLYRIAADGTIRDSIELSLQNGVERTERAGDVLPDGPRPSGTRCPARRSSRRWRWRVIRAQGYAGGDRGHAEAVLALRWLAVLALSSCWPRSPGGGLARSGCPGASGSSGRDSCCSSAFPPFVGFLLHRRWPVREPCPHCHARSARDRDACAECGDALPGPGPQRHRDLRLKR